LQQVFQSEDISSQIENSKTYLTRLGAKGAVAPIFVNGVPIKNDDEWLQSLSQRVSVDLRLLQRSVFEETLAEDTWVPSYFLDTASLRRNPLVIPEDEKDIKLLNLVNIYQGELETVLPQLPTISASESSEKELWTQLIVIGDFDSKVGLELIQESIKFRREHDNVEITFVSNGNSPSIKSPRIVSFWPKDTKDWSLDKIQSVYRDIKALIAAPDDVAYDGSEFWPVTLPLVIALGFEHGQSGLVMNGRKLGPIPVDAPFTKEDFQTLYNFEVKRRIEPAANAVKDLGFSDHVKDALKAAKLCSVLAVSTVSDMPEGIFELPPPVRTRMFYDWNSTDTAITIGDNSTALFQIIVSLDPATEIAQRWAPILKVLSELKGVYMRLYLNPKEKLSELPVKRFYRYALATEPSFDDDGTVQAVNAHFAGIPKETLLTVGMDVPPSWLVAPKDSVHDLDNVKLSSLPVGTDLDATYELENILVEGHSRDTTNGGMPPRGAQLVLSTASETHFADTIIMANLGYFQFKANPGLYNITLQPGLSQKIFQIDSVGALGHDPQPGDENTEVALLSFQGVTLYPRLSRKPGMEEEDVLGTPKTGAAADIVSKGAGIVGGLLKKAGMQQVTGTFLRTLQQTGLFPYNIAQWTHITKASTQADINIFSVASGHLYERMLNIMMVSVMRHTKHTVKFWFIEQFLSSSFKEFLPSLAKEYGFKYEMVTYKWPHWLRAQKEKQREIWGYKILFLDVLFPLDLDKVIFVDADQIVRTDMYELVTHDLKGAPYGFTPMCDSRTEMEGFRFWKQGYWKNFLRGLPYHISALYVVDLKRFRQIAAGDRLRQQYHQLSADPNSLSNLDQDLPNNMQTILPIHSLPQEWLWCETWCSDESLKDAKTIDLCNNPETKEPKLDRARRQVPEWTEYDDEIAALAKKVKGSEEVVQEEKFKGGDEVVKEEKSKTEEEAGRPSVKDEL
jgi:UDP-glucose:glycoprotein glucosyltransferase